MNAYTPRLSERPESDVELALPEAAASMEFSDDNLDVDLSLLNLGQNTEELNDFELDALFDVGAFVH